jgi:hypothetical protein
MSFHPTACLVSSVLCLAAANAAPPERRREVEADWALQAAARSQQPTAAQTTSEDAAGAVDGIKDGRWGFHTAEEESPWWQVDLGSLTVLDRVLVFNRADAVAPRAARLVLLLSADGSRWSEAYRHDGTVLLGAPDGKPLQVALGGRPARFVRLQIPGRAVLHLDEVEVYGVNGTENLAMEKPCDQSSLNAWSTRKPRAPAPGPDPERAREREERWAARRAALAHPLLDFDAVVFLKRVPGTYSHMSDQNYGWWSRPGGGVCVLEGFKADEPRVRSLTDGKFPPGSFLGLELSHDAGTVLFAYARHDPELAAARNKVDKEKLPEETFYHLFEMRVDGSGLRQLTRGRYDDFDARYLPGGGIVFLSTRRGAAFQCGAVERSRSPAETRADSYVRCGGGASRPVAVYTLHRMGPDGADIRAISPFESFEWNPSVAADGRILYARWDYVDRDNMPYMKLWSIRPDGTGPQAIYGNLTVSPYAVFEARQVPGSPKIVFTASAHHSITGGSLVLLDPSQGTDGPAPLARLTPEVCFPEIEGWPRSYFASPYPLSEHLHLVAWSGIPLATEGRANPPNAQGLYLLDAQTGALELLYRDPAILSLSPLPLRPRATPPELGEGAVRDAAVLDGLIVVLDVHQGLEGISRGSVKALRVVGVPPKTQPEMNSPMLGVTGDDPGKCVLGTVPVEVDGSAYFHAPAGVSLFFQALDERGLALQTMRSVTHVQAGETLACVGCHERRASPPPNSRSLASSRPPSPIRAGPDGSWPYRFDRLVQPVLERHCTVCHRPEAAGPRAAKLDLTPGRSYESLVAYGSPSLRDQVKAAYRLGRSVAGGGGARASQLLALLDAGHEGVKLDADSFERIVTWLDTYGQRFGSFSEAQEEELRGLRLKLAGRVVE